MKKKQVSLADLQQRHRELMIEAQKRELETIESMEAIVLALTINAQSHVQQCNVLLSTFMQLKREQENKPKLLLPEGYRQ